MPSPQTFPLRQRVPPALASLFPTARYRCAEDCLVALCAEKAKANWLVTRDAKGFERSPVPAISPADWLSLKRTEGFEYGQVELE